MNAQLKHYAELIEDYSFCCLLYRLDTDALKLMLVSEGDETRRELIEGEINARTTKN